MDSDEQEDERIRVAALKNAESIRIARQSYERELLAAKQALERKNEELQQQREWFEVTLASIGDAVITTDVDAKVTYLNPVAELLTGWSSTQAQGQPLERVFRIVNEDTQQPVENPIGKVLQSGRVIGLANHTALIDKNGHLTPIEDSAAPIRAPQGKIVGAVMVFHDVSDRRRAEEALRASQLRLRATFDQAAVGIVVADLNSQFVEANQRFCEFLGYSSDDLRRLTLSQVSHPDDLPEAQTHTHAVLSGQSAHAVFETRYIHKNGSTIWGRTTLTFLSDPSFDAQRFIGIVEDITDRKRTEQALNDARTQARPHRFHRVTVVQWPHVVRPSPSPPSIVYGY